VSPLPDPVRLCVVVPIYNEAATVLPLVTAVRAACTPWPCSMVLIDDGSTDGSGAQCDAAATSDASIQVVHFPANRGKTVALQEGFARATGDVVITLDSDMQDDPAEIPRFLAKLAEGFDLVCGWKVDRQDPWHKRWASKVYNGSVARLFGLPLHDINCGFKAMRIDVARGLQLERDYHRLIPVLAASMGYRVAEIAVRHHPRRHGRSKFGVERYWRGLRDTLRLWWALRVRSR